MHAARERVQPQHVAHDVQGEDASLALGHDGALLEEAGAHRIQRVLTLALVEEHFAVANTPAGEARRPRFVRLVGDAEVAKRTSGASDLAAGVLGDDLALAVLHGVIMRRVIPGGLMPVKHLSHARDPPPA